MTTKTIDLAVIGNGSVAYFCTYYIAKSCPSLQIGLFSETPRYFSASEAAGAMVNVFAEVEDDLSTSLHEQKCFELGIDSRLLWNNFFIDNNLTDLITAESTYLYLQKNQTEHELRNYHFACQSANEASSLRHLDQPEIKSFFSSATTLPESACELVGELSFSAPLFLDSMEKILRTFSNVQFFGKVTSVRESDINKFEISLENGNSIESNKVICAAGAKTKHIFPEIHFQDVVQSVGTALELTNIDISQLKRKVVRSVSRGGVQCGIHLVPRSNSIYVGAGSYVANSESVPLPRAEEIRYLLQIAEKDFLGRSAIYKCFLSPIILGSRPRSIDSYPLIGSLEKHPSLFIVTGTNRTGVTWSPSIAQFALSWVQGFSDKTKCNYDDLFGEWKPDRDLIPFGTNEKCLEYYVETRASNEYEHGLIMNPKSPEACSRIRAFGQKLLENVNKVLNLSSGLSIHPDSWALFYKENT